MPHHLIHVTLCRRHPLALAALLCLSGAVRAQAAAEAPAATATALAPVTVTAIPKAPCGGAPSSASGTPKKLARTRRSSSSSLRGLPLRTNCWR